MAKHSYEFSTEAQNRLSAFEDNKKLQEKQRYTDELIGEAGKTDFSEEAHLRLLEAQEYDAHLRDMNERDDTYNPMDTETTSAAFEREWDSAIEENEARDAAFNEKKEGLDAKLASNVKLRQIQRLSNNIEELRGQKVNADNADHLEQLLVAKEDRLESLLLAYENESTESPADRYETLDYALTGHVVSPSHVEATASTTESTSESSSDTPDVNEKAKDAKKSVEAEESTPLFDELARQHGLIEDEPKEKSSDTTSDSLAPSQEVLDAFDEDINSLAPSDEALAAFDADQAAPAENLAPSQETLDAFDEDSKSLAPSAESLAAFDADEAEPAKNLAPSQEALDAFDASESDVHHANEEVRDEETADPELSRNEERLAKALSWYRGTRLHGFFERKRASNNTNNAGIALGALVVAGTVAIIGSRLGWFHDFGVDPNDINGHGGGHGGDTGNNGSDHQPQAPKTPDTPAPAPVPTPNPEAILASYEPAFNVPYASGGEDLMKRLGVTPTEWYSKVAPGLLEKYPNDFYPEQVGNYVDVRFDRPGPLPKEIQRDILHRLGKI